MAIIESSWLASLKDLKDVPETQLEWFVENSAIHFLHAGETFLKPGEEIKFTTIIISGKFRLYHIQNGEIIDLVMLESGDITGYLPFSRGLTSSLFFESIGETEILNFPIERIQELIHSKYELTQALVHVMTSRVREATSLQQQTDKMMALGKLSAGLAHELNNPAAALVRASSTLKSYLKTAPEKIKGLTGLSSSVVEFLTQLLPALYDAKKAQPFTLLERTEQEEILSEWLADNKIVNCDELAENLVEYHVQIAQLENIKQASEPKSLEVVLNLIESLLVTDKMVSDIETSSSRISELVKSVKVFTHMDQGLEKQPINIHLGLQNTISMLNHKIKKGNIKLNLNYDDKLPEVNVRIGELNQVWTNIIDNALDAMKNQDTGEIDISTSHDTCFVQVIIKDSGPGIPEEIIDKIFDPFFTTKDIDEGTGLGLDMVARIIRQHRGTIKAESKPGYTKFTVCLPVGQQ